MSFLRHRPSATHAAVAAAATPPLPLDRVHKPPSIIAARARLRTLRAPSLDMLLLMLLTVLSLLTRVYRISHPAAVVFDEFHFFRFLRQQLQRQFVFDIHPWLGKLTHYVVARLFALQPRDTFDVRIGARYYNRDYVVSRVASALFGVPTVPLTFLIARELHLSTPSCVLAALMPLLDNLLIMQSRYILLDSQLITYLNLTLLCALRLWRHARSRYGSPRYYRMLLCTAVSGALAMSVKWTAAVTPFLIAVVCAFGGTFVQRPLPLLDALVAAVVSALVYLLPWLLYLRLSVYSSPSTRHMSDAFRHTLRGNASFPYRAQHNVSLLHAVYELHWRQFRANQNVKTRHAWESRWYEWPINARGLLFYINKAPNFSEQQPFVETLYLIQNPAGALWVSAAVVSSVLLLLLLQRYQTLIPPKHHVWKAAATARFLCAGYILNLLPYMFVERCYFLYHYLPALTYGQLLLALVVDLVPKPVRFAALLAVIGTTLAAFVHWSPWIYATPTTVAQYKQLQWMPRWT